jgi:acetyl esterase/lipase
MGLDSFGGTLQRYGSRFDPEVLAATVAHWAGRAGSAVFPGIPAIDDMAYGTHGRHRLDLFPVKGRGAPVVLFVHGGGFVGGDKQVAPPFYANVGRYFAAHGMLAACMNYRRAPTGGWPAAAEDVEAAVQWLLQRADLYGGDAARLVVIGQSAGACHVATWLFHPAFSGGVRGRARGAVLMSGFYRAAAPMGPGHIAYFGDDATCYADRSPLTHAHATGHPLLVTVADHDPEDLRGHTTDLVDTLTRAGAAVQTAELKEHNHVSPLMSLGSDDDGVGLRLRRFVSQATSSAAAASPATA